MPFKGDFSDVPSQDASHLVLTSEALLRVRVLSFWPRGSRQQCDLGKAQEQLDLGPPGEARATV